MVSPVPACITSAVGKLVSPEAEATAQHGAPGDVYDQIIALHADPRSRYLRLRFAGRNAGEILTLSEVEIWSAAPDRQPD